MASTLKPGDNWEVHMRLEERWADAGGFSNPKYALTYKRLANAMKKRLKAAGIPHPFDKGEK